MYGHGFGIFLSNTDVFGSAVKENFLWTVLLLVMVLAVLLIVCLKLFRTT